MSARTMMAEVRQNSQLQSSLEESAPTAAPSRSALPPYCLILAAIWMVKLGLLGLLQACGGDMGLDVWPLCEDFGHLHLLEDRSAQSYCNSFWGHDGRNPLCPWWF